MEQIKKNKLLRHNEYYDTQEIFDKLYEDSLKNKKFKNLIELITNEQNIRLAYRNIKGNKGSKTSGVNKTNIINIANDDFSKLIDYVKNRLQNYQPHKVKRVEIPKSNGKTRPLGIPTIEDRLIQQCIKQILEPIAEAKFYKDSYGFRPNRSAENAIARVETLINISKTHYVVDIDIKGFFDNVNHSKLLKQMWAMGIQDKSLLQIISRMLKAEILNVGIPKKGTPQGGILSPLLSNIVLNELDWWVANQWESFELKYKYKNHSKRYTPLRKTKLKEIYIVRYCDDFKILCKDYKVAQKIFVATKMWLNERLSLEISNEKSKVVNLRKNYSEFLGFKHKVRKKGKKYVAKAHISDKSKDKIGSKIKEAIQNIKNETTTDNVSKYNSIILGIQNYYRIANQSYEDFRRIAYSLNKSLYNKTKTIRGSTGDKSKAYNKIYGHSGKKVIYIAKIALFPLEVVKYKVPMQLQKNVCNYTDEGRKIIHDNLKGISRKTIEILLANPIKNQSVEYNDNRISLYVGQNGNDYVTNKSLIVGKMEVHHRKPRSKGGDDSYKNLILISYEIHKLIHVTDIETIKKYLTLVQLDEKGLQKLNKLRIEIDNYKLDKTTY